MTPNDIFSVAGKTALVTGAANGLGAEICAVLAQNGAHVFALDVDNEGLTRLATDYDAITPIMCDTCDSKGVSDAVAMILARHPSLDIVIANAGISDPKGDQIHALNRADIDRVIDVNLGGTITVAQASLGQMAIQKSGKFIAVASMWGLSAPAGLFARPSYAASKGAIVNLVRELALEYAKDNVQINALCPGFFRTQTRPRDEQHATVMKDYTPMGRIAETSEIAGSLLYLASSASDFATGTTLVIDGGVSAR